MCRPSLQVWVTREYTMYGRYKLRLYDGARMKWRTVVVDDYIPCECVGAALRACCLYWKRSALLCCTMPRAYLALICPSVAFQCRAGH